MNSNKKEVFVAMKRVYFEARNLHTSRFFYLRSGNSYIAEFDLTLVLNQRTRRAEKCYEAVHKKLLFLEEI